MSSELPQIYFYLEERDKPVHVLEKVDLTQQSFGLDTTYNWTLQTYLRLKANGLPCTLTGTMPAEGIVLAVRGNLPFDLKPNPKLLVVCMRADGGFHPYAQIHIVQNPTQVKADSYFMPHWPEPGLIPREDSRGETFKVAAYIGAEVNLAPELQSEAWRRQATALGLEWRLVSESARMNDYRDIDVVVAVRSFDHNAYSHKPASKLYNAWRAGVPAILGPESAYRAERRNELDYLEVRTLEEVISSLKKLGANSSLRQAMIVNGFERAAEIETELLIERWCKFILMTVVPAYRRWIDMSSIESTLFMLHRYLNLRWSGLCYRALGAKDQI